jgi:hypothetical protein
VEGGTAGLNLLCHLEQAKIVVFVDAVSGFTHPGHMVVLTGPPAPDGAGDLPWVLLTFSVKDSGIGLPPVSGDMDPRGDTGTDSHIPLTEKEKKVMQHFSDLLNNGELTAEELLPDIRAILTRCGFQAELTQIREKMDEIEYDTAVQIIDSLFI